MRMPCRPTLDRILEKVFKRPDGCWEYTGYKDRSGYGMMSYNGRTERVHRVMFFLTHGEWPTADASHKCHWKPCCNPEHIVDESRSENMLRHTRRSIPALCDR